MSVVVEQDLHHDPNLAQQQLEQQTNQIGVVEPEEDEENRRIPPSRRRNPHHRVHSHRLLSQDDDDDNGDFVDEELDHHTTTTDGSHRVVGVTEEEEEEEEEATRLMSADSYLDDAFEDEDYDEDERFCPKSMIVAMVCVLVVALLAVTLPGIRSNSKELEALRTPARLPVEYDCPGGDDDNNNGDDDASTTTTTAPSLDADNYDAAKFSKDYMAISQQITDNITEFIQTFREANFDNWGHSYMQVKEGMRHFKSTYYPPYVQDGSTIYESACGIGLNLYMTLEILQETQGIENLFVYGNELLPISTDKANAVMDNAAPAHARKGMICTGDSSHLNFVPSNSFDLVYSGYVSPLLDPLHFQKNATNENYGLYTSLCQSEADDWKGLKLNEIAQQRQDDWYGQWVSEMARIAKPGTPISVEQVSNRYCDAKFDWGGVNKDFWYTAASNDTYGWNIDPASIVMEDDTIFRDRYHVFMVKNGKRQAL